MAFRTALGLALAVGLLAASGRSPAATMRRDDHAPTPIGSSPIGVPTPQVVTAEVMVLHASNTGGGIDARVADLPQLRKPPFSTYDTYRLVATGKASLVQGADTPTSLPDGGQLHLYYRDTVAPNRRRVIISMQKPDGGVFLRSLEVTSVPDEPFFVAGYAQRDGGIFVVGIRVLR